MLGQLLAHIAVGEQLHHTAALLAEHHASDATASLRLTLSVTSTSLAMLEVVTFERLPLTPTLHPRQLILVCVCKGEPGIQQGGVCRLHCGTDQDSVVPRVHHPHLPGEHQCSLGADGERHARAADDVSAGGGTPAQRVADCRETYTCHRPPKQYVIGYSLLFSANRISGDGAAISNVCLSVSTLSFGSVAQWLAAFVA